MPAQEMSCGERYCVMVDPFATAGRRPSPARSSPRHRPPHPTQRL